MPANVHYVFASYNGTAVQWWRDVALLVQRLSSALTTLDPQVAAQWQSRLHIAAVPALELLGDLQQVLRGWHFPGAAAVDRFGNRRPPAVDNFFFQLHPVACLAPHIGQDA